MGTLIALPAGAYNWYDTNVSGVPTGSPTSVTVAALTAGTISPASPSVGATLSVTGSNAPPGAAFLWEVSTDAGVSYGNAGGTNNAATYSTTGQPAGLYRRRTTLVNGAVATTAAVTLAAGGAFSDDFNRADGAVGASYVASTLSAQTANPGFTIASNELRFAVSTLGGSRLIRSTTLISGTAFAQATFLGRTGTPAFGVALDDPVTGRAVFARFNRATGVITLFRRTSAGANLGSSLAATAPDTPDIVANDVMRIERTVVDASTVQYRVYRNGSIISGLTFNDTDAGRVSGDVYGGITAQDDVTGTGAVRFDNFSQGNV